MRNYLFFFTTALGNTYLYVIQKKARITRDIPRLFLFSYFY
jgi:hypothetical protein